MLFRVLIYTSIQAVVWQQYFVPENVYTFAFAITPFSSHLNNAFYLPMISVTWLLRYSTHAL